jgi:hypothetical protein
MLPATGWFQARKGRGVIFAFSAGPLLLRTSYFSGCPMGVRLKSDLELINEVVAALYAHPGLLNVIVDILWCEVDTGNRV